MAWLWSLSQRKPLPSQEQVREGQDQSVTSRLSRVSGRQGVGKAAAESRAYGRILSEGPARLGKQECGERPWENSDRQRGTWETG